MKQVDLTQGKVTSVILSLALPIMLSSLLQFTYNLIDMIWIGGLGSNSVASIGSTSFYIGLGYSINALVVVGTGIKVSHAIGKKNNEEVQKYINAGLLLNVLIGIVYSIVLIFLGKNLIGFLRLGNWEVENGAYLYMLFHAPIIFLGFFNALYTRIFNSFGNNGIALKISAIGIIINTILDPILIYTFKLGIVGAAIGTLVANIVMFILFHLNSNGIIKFNLKVKIDLDKIREIIILGSPMSFQRILFTVVNIIIARLIAIFGADAIAAQKIGVQIESITFMVIGGLNGAVTSFVGQNYGAKKFERVIQGYKSSIKIGILYSSVTALVFMFMPKVLVEIFLKDEDTVLIACKYLQIVAVSQIFSAVEMVSNGLFTGMGKPKIPAYISIIFTVLRIPMAFILIKLCGLDGVWWSISSSSILKGLISYILYKYKIQYNSRGYTA